ncbi:MAG: sulfite exporter TauE/SafE family protein [Longimicrobiales bacterium]|nr:sulfite exporter TauE/SafE family protein [Longimicrobiales bacterium]
MLSELLPYAYILGTGLAAGTLNVLAGGGSALTLPLLIFLGLPPTVANGTNRVAILAQNVAAALAFRRHGISTEGLLWTAVPPALVGAGLGTWTALVVGDAAFQRILSGVMVFIAVWMVWRPLPGGPRDGRQKVEDGSVEDAEAAATEDDAVPGAGAAEAAGGRPHRARPPFFRSSPSFLRRVGVGAGFFLVGFYGGFIQAGVGFLILAMTSAAGLDLVRGNALKVLLVLTFTPLTLGLFWLGGAVEWGSGLTLALGMAAGGLIGVRLNVLKGHAWVRRVVTAAVVLFAVRLWWTS